MALIFHEEDAKTKVFLCPLGEITTKIGGYFVKNTEGSPNSRVCRKIACMCRDVYLNPQQTLRLSPMSVAAMVPPPLMPSPANGNTKNQHKQADNQQNRQQNDNQKP
jgi:hypothetical protein